MELNKRQIGLIMLVIAGIIVIAFALRNEGPGPTGPPSTDPPSTDPPSTDPPSEDSEWGVWRAAYGISQDKCREILSNLILEGTWGSLGASSVANNGWSEYQGAKTGKLYATYADPSYSSDGFCGTPRCDVYDNALLVSVLLMCRDDPVKPYMEDILDFFSTASLVNMANGILYNTGLVFAAYVGNPGTSGNTYSCEEEALDVGNNAMVCIALAKFCLAYPDHPKVPTYIETIRNICGAIQYLRCTYEGVTVFARRAGIDDAAAPSPQCVIATEHMIDLVGLGGLIGQLGDLASAELHDYGGMFRDVYRFVGAMFSSSHSLFMTGTTDPPGEPPNDTNPPAVTTPNEEFPVDTNTWNMLARPATGDAVSISDLHDALAQVSKPSPEGFFVESASGMPGIKFKKSGGGECAQFENTGSYLCALREYYRQTGESVAIGDTAMGKIDSIYSGIHGKLVTDGTAIQGAYDGSDCDGQGCESGYNYCYYFSPHLASTVYCLNALLQLTDPAANMYQWLQ